MRFEEMSTTWKSFWKAVERGGLPGLQFLPVILDEDTDVEGRPPGIVANVFPNMKSPENTRKDSSL